jgi:hypothetical protein
VLDSRPEGKFEKFYFKENTPIVFNKVPQAYISGISVPIYAAPKKQIKVESQQNLL